MSTGTNIEKKDYTTSAVVDVQDIPFADEAASPRDVPASLAHLSSEEIEAMSKKLVRKMDLVIMPILGILYILNYIDRQNLAAAKVQGIQKDLGMTTTQFATAISILFVGYLPMQIPSQLIISSIPRPGLYICVCCTIWGCISASCAAVKNHQQLWAARAILGAVEAAFFPGSVYYLSSWYTKTEIGKRIGGLYVAQQFGNAFGGLFAAAVLKLQGVHGLYGWQWLFIIEGALTVGIGGVAAFFMPEFPYNAKMLSPIERDLAVWRITSEAGAAEGAIENEGTWKPFLQAFKDPKLYIYILFNIFMQVLGSISNVYSIILASLGFSATKTLCMQAPPYVLAGFMYWLISWYSDRKNTVYPLILGLLSLGCATYIIPMVTVNVAARYFAMFILPFASVGPQILIYKTINLHIPRPTTKRAAAVSLVSAIGGTSNIWVTYLYVGAPHYYRAYGTLFGCAACFAVALTAYRWYILNENKKLDSGDPEQIASACRYGITPGMVEIGWRYEMF